jgi:omega-6 fatty acid desaturase (delta-12 desaturase)
MKPAEAAQKWRSAVRPEWRAVSDLRGTLILLRAACLYLLLFAGTFLLPDWWMRLLCLALVPFAIGALFVIGHDAGHSSLTRAARLNRALGRIAMLPAYHPFTSWIYTHNILHHGGTCLKQKHPDFTPMSFDEFRKLSLRRRVLERIYRSPLGVGLSYLVEFYGGYLLFPKPSRSCDRRMFHLDQFLVAAFAVFQCAGAYALTALTPGLGVPRWSYALGAIFLPWLTWIFYMGIASFVQHTHPRTVWFDDEEEWEFYEVQLRGSTHMLLPWGIGAILHNIMDHAAHHIDPTIPLTGLPASQKLLEEYVPDHSIVSRLTIREYLKICRTCQLYDYRRQCWLDFHGQPTTVPLRSA